MIAFRVINAPAVAESLTGSAARVFVAVLAEMRKQMGQLANYVQSEKLHGQVLNQRTGNLARSIIPDVQQSGDQIQGTVGIADANTVPYAAFWELGFQGTETVREHLRTNPSGTRSIVREHSREVNQGARSYLATSFQERADSIVAALQSSVDRSLHEAA
jgi:hypothetical protein